MTSRNGTGGNGTSGLGFFVQPNSADVGQANPTGASLSGTPVRQPVNGIASFTNLAIDRAGTYTLQASASGATPVSSNGFTINAP